MVSLSGVTKSYGKQIVVDNLTLTVQKGRVFGFLGQNGAGKTTAVKMMVGISFPDKGSITIAGKNPADSSVREMIGFMPEAPYFYERLTGFEFLKFCRDLFPPERQRKDAELDEILKEVGIYDAKDKKIGAYSKGMKQRLGFAQALVNDPEYIFLDEPLDGLDPIGRKEIKSIIKSLKARGKTIFFNSHILYDTEELCDEIGIIHEGKLLYSGSVKEFCEGKSLEEKFVSLVENQ